MRKPPLLHKEYTRHNSCELRDETNSTCVQVMSYMRQMSIKHEIIIITIKLLGSLERMSKK